MRDQADNLQSYRTNHCNRNHIRTARSIDTSRIIGIHQSIATLNGRLTWSRLCHQRNPASSVRVSRKGIVDGRVARANVPVAEWICWDSGVVEFPANVVNAEDVKEKEGFIFNDRATNRSTIVVIGGSRQRIRQTIEISAGGQCADSVVLVRGAVKLIRSRFKNYICDGATSASKFSGVVARSYIRRLDRLGRRDIDLKKARPFVVVHTLNR